MTTTVLRIVAENKDYVIPLANVQYFTESLRATESGVEETLRIRLINTTLEFSKDKIAVVQVTDQKDTVNMWLHHLVVKSSKYDKKDNKRQ